jgi:hypothetical protein
MTAISETSVTVLLAPENSAEIATERGELEQRAQVELPEEIVSPQEYKAVGALETRLAAFIATYEPVFDENCAAAHKAWKTSTTIRGLFLDPARALLTKCRRLRGGYEQKEKAAREAEERRIAEAQRQQEIDRQNREAKLLEKQGQKEMAAAVRSQPVYAQPVVLPSAVPEVEGMRKLRSNWTWRIIGASDRKDKAARKRAAQLVPREYLTLDDAALTAFATNSRGTVKIPGIEIYEEKV